MCKCTSFSPFLQVKNFPGIVAHYGIIVTIMKSKEAKADHHTHRLSARDARMRGAIARFGLGDASALPQVLTGGRIPEPHGPILKQGFKRASSEGIKSFKEQPAQSAPRGRLLNEVGKSAAKRFGKGVKEGTFAALRGKKA